MKQRGEEWRNMDQIDVIIQLKNQANRFLAEAAALQDKAETLFKTAAILEEKKKADKGGEGQTGQFQLKLDYAAGPKVIKPSRADRGTRLLQVKSALRFGPLTRSEIQRHTRIPKGTLDHLLKPGGAFAKDEEGRFYIPKNPELVAMTSVADILSMAANQAGDKKN
jgi:hypothetical protein